jgi:hypothetical protein
MTSSLVSAHSIAQNPIRGFRGFRGFNPASFRSIDTTESMDAKKKLEKPQAFLVCVLCASVVKNTVR